MLKLGAIKARQKKTVLRPGSAGAGISCPGEETNYFDYPRLILSQFPIYRLWYLNSIYVRSGVLGRTETLALNHSIREILWSGRVDGFRSCRFFALRQWSVARETPYRWLVRLSREPVRHWEIGTVNGKLQQVSKSSREWLMNYLKRALYK